MIRSLSIGIATAIFVLIPRYLHSKIESVIWVTPIDVIAIGVLAMLLQKYVIEKLAKHSRYVGISDVIFQMHHPFGGQSSTVWVVRGFISMLLSCVSSSVGTEGAAIEFAYAIQTRWVTRYSKWFEQKRRTDVGSCLAGGLSAAFGAPLAGVLFPIELGVGGSSASAAVSALAAFLFSRFLFSQFSLNTLDVHGMLPAFHFERWTQWAGIGMVGVCTGVLAAMVIQFVRYTQDSLESLFQRKVWMRALTGAMLLGLVFAMDHSFREEAWSSLEQILWLKVPAEQVLLVLMTQWLTLAIVLASFGTAGVVWPVLLMGGAIGFCVNHWVLKDLLDFATIAGLSGCAAFCGAVLGAPLTASVLIYEMTQNIQILVPCLLAAGIAQQFRKWLKTKTFIEHDLHWKGLSLVHGKSLQLLESMIVSETMVRDFELIRDDEIVSELKGKALQSRYPFLPVINVQGLFTGLLSLDHLQEAWQGQEKMTSSDRVSKVLEVKDLLYRVGRQDPWIRSSDRVSQVIHHFEAVPCLAVLGEEGGVLGLLFLENVRLAYDREVAKASYVFMQDGGRLIR